MDLTDEEVQTILKLVDQLDYGEIHLKVGDLRVDLVKEPPSSSTARARASDSIVAERAPKVPASPTPGVVAPVTQARIAGASLVAAPVAGTFYRAPAPGAKPFVEVGQRVAAMDPVCIIEVMKLFQSISAGVAGTVVQVLVEDGTAVSHGQPLIAIEAGEAQ